MKYDFKIYTLLCCLFLIPLGVSAQGDDSEVSYGTGYSLMATPPDNYRLGVRTNLIQWAILTPNLGAEWRMSKNYALIFNAAYTKWNWKDGNRRFHFWHINPEGRWYLGTKKRAYFGGEFHYGKFNTKLNDIGRDGYFRGGGLTGGYQMCLNANLSLDFNLGIGCTHFGYLKYRHVGDSDLPIERKSRNVWGISQVGVSLVWKVFDR